MRLCGGLVAGALIALAAGALDPRLSPERVAAMDADQTSGVVRALLSPLGSISRLLSHQIETHTNTTYQATDIPNVTHRMNRLHESLLVIDLHADTLLSGRNILNRSATGHVDLPRLMDGNVALQVFSVVTRIPVRTKRQRTATQASGYCINNRRLIEGAWPLYLVQGRPIRTLWDMEQRALDQASRLRKFVAESQRRHASDPSKPRLMLIESKGDLSDLIQLRRRGEPVVGALLALEGVHWLTDAEGDGVSIRQGVRRLFDAGFRMVAATHRFTNELGGASEGCGPTRGLTRAGRIFLKAAEDLNMIVDLAHASEAMIADATREHRKPLVISHGGIQTHCRRTGRCNTLRTVSDASIRAVARTGGVVAIGYWVGAVGEGYTSLAEAFRSAYDILDAPAFVAEMRRNVPNYDPLDHIALGSDFDGGSLTPFDAAGVAKVTAALAGLMDASGRRVFDRKAIHRIVGANACRLMMQTLPGSNPSPDGCVSPSLGVDRSPVRIAHRPSK